MVQVAYTALIAALALTKNNQGYPFRVPPGGRVYSPLDIYVCEAAPDPGTVPFCSEERYDSVTALATS